jgi:hypothetical protein
LIHDCCIVKIKYVMVDAYLYYVPIRFS